MDVRKDFYKKCKNTQLALLKSENLLGGYISETHITNTRQLFVFCFVRHIFVILAHLGTPL